ncbi:hypothetical protein ACLOJK_040882 [Asimina triloba]
MVRDSVAAVEGWPELNSLLDAFVEDGTGLYALEVFDLMRTNFLAFSHSYCFELRRLARINKTENGETLLELDNGKTLLAKEQRRQTQICWRSKLKNRAGPGLHSC